MAIVRGARHRIHRHSNRANLCRAKEARNELDRIRQRDQDAVARLTARIEQRVGHAFYLEFKLTVTCLTLNAEYRRFVRIFARRPGDEFIRNVEHIEGRYGGLRHGGRFYITSICGLASELLGQSGTRALQVWRTIGDPDYCVADFSPSRRMRSCSFLRRVDGALGLNATRYHKGCVRSRLRRVSVAASLFGCRAIFSRIAEYGWCERCPSVLAETFGCSLINRSK